VNKISKAVIGGIAVAGLALGVLTTTSASAATGAGAPSNVVSLQATTRVVPTPGHLLAGGQTFTVQATGTGAGQADPGATAVFAKVTAIVPSGTGSLVAHAVGTGAPGNPTVAYTKGGEPSGMAWVRLNSAGQFLVTASGASTRVLVELDAEGTTAPTPVQPAATTFGVGQVWINTKFGNTQWAQYETAELGAPGGDQASGSFRFTCTLDGGCDLSLKAFSTAAGFNVYPRIILEKEDNTSGAKLTCEYADGSDNDGATFALADTATTVPLGIGSTADCGGDQTGTQPASVDHINVPGSSGQGVHYDAFVTLTFTPAAN
jgi:hypothetical protein